jgi:hypothetical protein
MFLERQMLFGAIFYSSAWITRIERWTIFMLVILIQLFVTGLFYDDGEGSKDEDEEEKSAADTILAFGWKDFWIIFYSCMITIPIPLLLKTLFTR